MKLYSAIQRKGHGSTVFFFFNLNVCFWRVKQWNIIVGRSSKTKWRLEHAATLFCISSDHFLNKHKWMWVVIWYKNYPQDNIFIKLLLIIFPTWTIIFKYLPRFYLLLLVNIILLIFYLQVISERNKGTFRFTTQITSPNEKIRAITST